MLGWFFLVVGVILLMEGTYPRPSSPPVYGLDIQKIIFAISRYLGYVPESLLDFFLDTVDGRNPAHQLREVGS